MIVNLSKIFILVVGVLCIGQVKVENWPIFSTDVVVVKVPYAGASAIENEEQVARTLEESIESINGIQNSYSLSHENYTALAVFIDTDLPQKRKDQIVKNIRENIDGLTNLPEGTGKPTIEEYNSEIPVVRMAITGTDKAPSFEDIAQLKKELRQIKNAGSVFIYGMQEKELVVELSPERLKAHQMTVSDVISFLKYHQLNVPAGFTEVNNEKVALRAIGKTHNAAQLGEQVIVSNFQENQTKINDLGVVRYQNKAIDQNYLYDGQPCVFIEMYRDSNGHINQVSKDVYKVVHNFNENHALMTATIFEDNTKYVNQRINTLKGNLWQAVIIVTVTCLIFLGLKYTLLIVNDIPFTLLGTIIIMNLLGMSFNVISLGALTAVCGILVDDAIVLSENILRHRKMNKSIHQAAVDGVLEVAWPIVMTVVTTVIALMPLMFLSGFAGKIARDFPLIISITLLVSLFEAFFMMPVHLVHYEERFKSEKSQNGLMIFLHRKMQKYYLKGLIPILRIRHLFLALSLILFIITMLVGKSINFSFFPKDFPDTFYVMTKSHPGTTPEKNLEALTKVSQMIQSYPKGLVKGTLVSSGITDLFVLKEFYTERTGAQFGQVSVYFHPQTNGPIYIDRFKKDLEKKINSSGLFKEFNIVFKDPEAQFGKAINLQILGDDFDAMEAGGREIFDYLKKIPGVYGLNENFGDLQTEYHLELKQDQIARYGLSNVQILQELRAAFSGIKIETFIENNEKMEFVVKNNINGYNLEKISIRTPAGGMSNLAQFVSLKKVKVPSEIIRKNGDRMFSIKGDINPKLIDLNQLIEKVNQKVSVSNNKKFKIEFSGQKNQTDITMGSLNRSFAIAIALIAVIMIIYFNNFKTPLIILTTIPLTVVGTVFCLKYYGMPWSFPVVFGMVSVCGIVINNAIVMVTFMDQLRRESGFSLIKAVVSSSKLRLLSIFLTTFTTVIDLWPTAHGIGGYDPFLGPMFLTLMWGLNFSMAISLFVVPCMYWVLADKSVSKKDYFQNRLVKALNGLKQQFTGEKTIGFVEKQIF